MIDPKKHPDECVYEDEADCDICRSCGDHTRFCEYCAESECCGAKPYTLD